MLEISDNLRRKIRSKEYEPILILEIEGLPACSSAPANKVLRFDEDYLFDDVVSFDQSVRDRAIKVLIDLKGQSSSITQNMNYDTGGEIASTSFSVCLVDHRGIVTEWITPGAIVDDVLGKKAKVWLNVQGGIHPEDSVLIAAGMVDGYTSETNRINLNICSPEQYKRGDLFPKVTTEIQDFPAASSTLSGAVGADQSDWPLVSTSGFPDPGSILGLVARRFRLLIGGSEVSSYFSITGSDLDYNSPDDVTMTHGAHAGGTTVSLHRYLLAGDTSEVRLVDSSQFLEPSADGTLECYVKIDDEIIQYTSAAGGILSDMTRGCFGTTAVDHEWGSEVTPIYRLQGSMAELALKIMLSGAENPYFYETEEAVLTTFNGITVANSIWFPDTRFDECEARVGDLVRVRGDVAGNTETDVEILSITQHSSGYWYIVIDATISAEEDVEVKLKSQYNVLPQYAGLGMNPDQVDIAQHLEIEDTYFTQLFDFDLLIKDTIKGSELINKQLYLPNGCFAMPRQGKASLGIIAPPIIGEGVQTLDETNVVGADKIKIARSLNRNFYNAVTFQYEKHEVEDRYTRHNAYISGTSAGRIKIPTKALSIKADGVRYDADSDSKARDLANRFLERYQYGAETFEIQVLYSIGLFIEIGDTVLFDGSELNMSDTKTGERGMRTRAMAVFNKTISPWKGKVTLTLIDTSFSVNARYGTLAPASTVGSGSSTTVINLALSDDTNLPGGTEGEKWAAYVGQTIAARSDDWSDYDEAIIQSIDGNSLILSSALSFTPAAGDFVEPPLYPDNADEGDQRYWKVRHCFLNPTVSIVSSSAQDRFTVDAGDIGKFLVGAVVQIHNADYSEISDEIYVESKSVNTVILETSVDFTITSDHVVELIGFKDGGQPYRWA